MNLLRELLLHAQKISEMATSTSTEEMRSESLAEDMKVIKLKF